MICGIVFGIASKLLCSYVFNGYMMRNHYHQGCLDHLFYFVNCRLVSKSPYPTSPEGKEAGATKPGTGAAPSPDAGCFGKSLASDELQPKVASNLA